MSGYVGDLSPEQEEALRKVHHILVFPLERRWRDYGTAAALSQKCSLSDMAYYPYTCSHPALPLSSFEQQWQTSQTNPKMTTTSTYDGCGQGNSKSEKQRRCWETWGDFLCVCSVMSRADCGQCALDVSRLSHLVSSPDHEEKRSGEPSWISWTSTHFCNSVT